MLAVLQQIIQVIEVLFTGVVSFFSNVSMLLSKIPEFFIFAEAAYYTLPSVLSLIHICFCAQMSLDHPYAVLGEPRAPHTDGGRRVLRQAGWGFGIVFAEAVGFFLGERSVVIHRRRAFRKVSGMAEGQIMIGEQPQKL